MRNMNHQGQIWGIKGKLINTLLCYYGVLTTKEEGGNTLDFSNLHAKNNLIGYRYHSPWQEKEMKSLVLFAR